MHVPPQFAAKKEGFALGTIIFLDIEEGGQAFRRIPRLSSRVVGRDSKHAGFLPGVYCSGIPVNEGHGVTITTADDIRSNSSTNDFTFWIYRRCLSAVARLRVPTRSSSPSSERASAAPSIWQFAQSPRRKEFTAHCRKNTRQMETVMLQVTRPTSGSST